ncbi:hypothetical protein [Hymenobacter metallicola]|uniref:DUF3325 domain-containing protein n=1 Tax=Hymenobacter metallicola TaxID=2563114 RepID=A0A4Z0PTJ7_9BACT|nr:hypothetical protein [Hymenobacter metallicola]TGE21017.1 hypothetical protein E5K02_24965 [Hymenobacter metallicola]
MFSTLFLLLLLAFQLWYLASPQVKLPLAGYPAYVARRPRTARLIGAALLAVAALLFGRQLGWMTGLSAWLVGLMGVGSLVVTLTPFRYLTGYSLLLYAVFLGLELIF